MNLDKPITLKLKSCDVCKKIFLKSELEDWGAYKVCKRCAKKYIIDKFPNKPKKEPDKILTIQTLKEAPNKYRNYAGYNPLNSEIHIYVLKEQDAERVITHEIVHYYTHKIEGLRATFQFDNVAFYVI